MSWPAPLAIRIRRCCSRPGPESRAFFSTRVSVPAQISSGPMRRSGFTREIDIVAWKRKSQQGIEYLKRLQRNRTVPRRPFGIESLESRVLPSGVNPFGLPVKKASFLDSDGDKVKIKMKGDLFTISLFGGATNNADVDTITIVPGKLG